MGVAQSLYENGYITYMRTDSTHVSELAQKEVKDYVVAQHGEKFLPAQTREYKTKAKGAQEAHEAIRPSDVSVEPGDLERHDGGHPSKSEEVYREGRAGSPVAAPEEASTSQSWTAERASVDHIALARSPRRRIRKGGAHDHIIVAIPVHVTSGRNRESKRRAHLITFPRPVGIR